MIERIGEPAIEELLSVLLRRCVYASLHTERPDFSRPSASEAAVGGYSRVRVVWSEQENGLSYNAEPLSFGGLLPPLQVVAVGLHRSAVAAPLEAYGMLDVPLQVTSEDFMLPTMALALQIA